MILNGVDSELELKVVGYEAADALESSYDEWLVFDIEIKENNESYKYHEKGPLLVNEAQYLSDWLNDVSTYPTRGKTLYEHSHSLGFIEPDFEFSFSPHNNDNILLVFSYNKYSHPLNIILTKDQLREAAAQLKDELSPFPDRSPKGTQVES